MSRDEKKENRLQTIPENSKKKKKKKKKKIVAEIRQCINEGELSTTSLLQRVQQVLSCSDKY